MSEDIDTTDPVAIGNAISISEIEAAAERAQRAFRSSALSVVKIDETADRLRRAREVRLVNAKRRGVPESEDVLRLIAMDAPLNTEPMRIVSGGIKWRGDVRGRPLALTLCGLPGTGKSAAVLRAAAEHDRSTLVVWANDIISTPRNGFSTNEAFWQQILSVDLLVIEEAGRTPKVDFDHVLVDLDIYRWDHGLATLKTSNLRELAYASRFGDGALGDRVSRKYQQGKDGAPVKMLWDFTGESLRGRL